MRFYREVAKNSVRFICGSVLRAKVLEIPTLHIQHRDISHMFSCILSSEMFRTAF